MSRIAICIVNYNLPAMTDALVDQLEDRLDIDHRLYVLDNGSDRAAPAEATTHRVRPNRRTTGGWNEALLHAAADGGFDAYWLLCNDVHLPAEHCPATPLLVALLRDGFGIVHPAYTPESRSAWKEMFHRPGAGTVATWAVEFNAPMIRADVLPVVWPFTAALTYGYGVDNETGYRARRAGARVGICHHTVCDHEPFTTYRAGADALGRDEYVHRATENMQAVLTTKYGPEWKRLFRGDTA